MTSLVLTRKTKHGHRLMECRKYSTKVKIEESVGKRVSPTQHIEFLGVWFDAVTGTMEVTTEKLQHTLELCMQWMHKTSMTRTELESLIGKLQFIAACVRPGRVFINRLLNQLRITPKHTQVCIESQTKLDINWWLQFLQQYNGVSVAWLDQFLTPDVVFATDASLKGCGGIWWGDSYFRLTFPKVWQGANIAYLEAWGVIVALKIWKDKLKGLKSGG